jgi:hypothetical protein
VRREDARQIQDDSVKFVEVRGEVLKRAILDPGFHYHKGQDAAGVEKRSLRFHLLRTVLT